MVFRQSRRRRCHSWTSETELRKGGVDLVLLRPLLDFLRPKQRQLDVS